MTGPPSDAQMYVFKYVCVMSLLKLGRVGIEDAPVCVQLSVVDVDAFASSRPHCKATERCGEVLVLRGESFEEEAASLFIFKREPEHVRLQKCSSQTWVIFAEAAFIVHVVEENTAVPRTLISRLLSAVADER